MEFGTIEREIYVEATPEVVFEVVSSPEHVQQWWPDEAHFEPVPGATGDIVFGAPGDDGRAVVQLTVLEAQPPRTFSFRWTHPFGEPATSGNSLLITFRSHAIGRRDPAEGHRDRLPRDGLGDRRPRTPVPRTHHRLGFLPAAVDRICGDTGGTAVTAGLAERIDDDLWSAIGDPTRRRIVDLLLADGDGTATTLSEQLPVTRQAVSKHLDVLDRVAMVTSTPVGREKRYRVDDAQLARAVAQLASVGSAWDSRLQRIKKIAEAIERNKNAPTASRPHESPQTKEKSNG